MPAQFDVTSKAVFITGADTAPSAPTLKYVEVAAAEIARASCRLSLASDASAYLTRQTTLIDGGFGLS